MRLLGQSSALQGPGKGGGSGQGGLRDRIRLRRSHLWIVPRIAVGWPFDMDRRPGTTWISTSPSEDRGHRIDRRAIAALPGSRPLGAPRSRTHPASRLAPETAALVRSMASANRLRGAERIRGTGSRLDRCRFPVSSSRSFPPADIEQVAADIFGLTKLNYNACRLGESQPVTIKFSDAVGEILVSNAKIERPKPQFRFYI